MKLNRETVSGVLGTTPQAQKNKTFAGVEYRSPKKGEVFFNESTWRTAKSDYSGTKHPVAIFEEVAKPTTLEDLYPTGNENVWLVNDEQHRSICLCGEDDCGDLMFADYDSIEEVKNEYKLRWSHSLHTKFSDANEFIAKSDA